MELNSSDNYEDYYDDEEEQNFKEDEDNINMIYMMKILFL